MSASVNWLPTSHSRPSDSSLSRTEYRRLVSSLYLFIPAAQLSYQLGPAQREVACNADTCRTISNLHRCIADEVVCLPLQIP